MISCSFYCHSSSIFRTDWSWTIFHHKNCMSPGHSRHDFHILRICPGHFAACWTCHLSIKICWTIKSNSNWFSKLSSHHIHFPLLNICDSSSACCDSCDSCIFWIPSCRCVWKNSSSVNHHIASWIVCKSDCSSCKGKLYSSHSHISRSKSENKSSVTHCFCSLVSMIIQILYCIVDSIKDFFRNIHWNRISRIEIKRLSCLRVCIIIFETRKIFPFNCQIVSRHCSQFHNFSLDTLSSIKALKS